MKANNNNNNEEAEKKSDERENVNELRCLLERANLAQYLNSFTEQGGDDLNQLCEADEQEFKEICDLVGMSSKPLHVRRLRKALDEHKANKKKTEAFNNKAFGKILINNNNII